jgi:hypothetical protein
MTSYFTFVVVMLSVHLCVERTGTLRSVIETNIDMHGIYVFTLRSRASYNS